MCLCLCVCFFIHFLWTDSKHRREIDMRKANNQCHSWKCSSRKINIQTRNKNRFIVCQMQTEIRSVNLKISKNHHCSHSHTAAIPIWQQKTTLFMRQKRHKSISQLQSFQFRVRCRVKKHSEAVGLKVIADAKSIAHARTHDFPFA